MTLPPQPDLPEHLPEQAPKLEEMRPVIGPDEVFRRAAVLLLVYPREGEDYMVFMRRTETVAHHRGQISLPGGAQDPDDPDLTHTALRETQEELGVDPRHVEVLGEMPEIFARVSGFLITPVVGRIRPEAPPIVFHPNSEEVAEVIEVPMRVLRDPATHHTRPIIYEGNSYNLHYYIYGPHEIWGATGRILFEFFRHPLSMLVAGG
jgi:8-oxo-dGTP pyrophosphatase MutT (NUDIX family)